VNDRSYRGRHRLGPAATSTPGPDRLYEIDLLRITAALAVVIYHYTFSGWAGHHTSISFPTLSQFTRYGYLGVDLFFTISGFVVLLSAWGRKPHQFVISRVIRLYPAYWVAVTLTTVIVITLSRGLFHVSPLQYVANLTMMNSLPNIANVDVVYWTLWAEIRFYLLVFVLCWIGITRSRVVTVLWLWLGATAIIELGVLPAGAADKLDLLVQSQWSHYFIAGMALCLIYRAGWSWHLGGVLVLATANAIYRAIGFGRTVSDRYHQTLHPTVIVTVVTLIVAVMFLIAVRATRRIGRAWFAVAGALTYPLYLVHAYNGFVLFNRFGHHVNRWVLLIATVTLMGSVAYAIHRFVETPLAPRLKRALVRLSEATRIAKPATPPAQGAYLPSRTDIPPGTDKAPRTEIAAAPSAPVPNGRMPSTFPPRYRPNVTDTDTITLILPTAPPSTQ
jgi:peptidoglycan/LPS O-acetylase OafA/YrhL